MFKKKNRDIALRHNCSKVGVRLRTMLLNSGERADIGRITASQSMPYVLTDGEMRMTGDK